MTNKLYARNKSYRVERKYITHKMSF